MTPGATLVASLLIAVSRPSTWALAMAGFLLRGGLLLLVAPIVVLPTAVGLANIVAPFLADVAFERRLDEVALLVAWLVGGLATWLIVGGFLTAAIEAELILRVAEDEELEATGRISAGRSVRAGWVGRIFVVRLLACLPLVLALAWGAVQVVVLTYRELTVPSDTDVPLVLRVVTGAPGAVVAIALAWFAAEIVGAMAARRIVLLEEGAVRALARAVRHLTRRPGRCLVLAILPLLQLALVLAAMGFAGSVAWDALRAALAFDDGWLARWALLIAFVGLFAAGFVLVGVTSAWRSAVWTVDLTGTFGGATDTPLGDWNEARPSATLGALRPREVDQDRGDG